MKKIILILALTSLSSICLGQYKKEDFSKYKPCNECFDKWKTVPEKSSQSYALRTNNAARRGYNSGKNFGKRLGGIVATIFIGAITVAVINKATTASNNAIK